MSAICIWNYLGLVSAAGIVHVMDACFISPKYTGGDFYQSPDIAHAQIDYKMFHSTVAAGNNIT